MDEVPYLPNNHTVNYSSKQPAANTTNNLFILPSHLYKSPTTTILWNRDVHTIRGLYATNKLLHIQIYTEMNTNHAHIEAAILTIAMLFLAYGSAWLMSWSIPVSIFGLPTVLVLTACVYVPVYFIRRRQWKE